MRRVAEETRIYEGMFLVKNKPAKEDFDGVLKEISSYLEEVGADIVNSSKWDERKLAYDIKGERRGTYLLFHFEAKPEVISRLERRCQISDLVLRVIVVRDTDGTELPPPGSGLSGGGEASPVAPEGASGADDGDADSPRGGDGDTPSAERSE